MNNEFINKNISPACKYCSVGFLSNDKTAVFCKKLGIMALDDHCKKFSYDPLKRIPKKAPEMPKFDEKDFSLDE